MNRPEGSHPFTPGRLVAAVLLVALGLRLALAAQGGQYYFGDEARYDRGVQLYLALAAGDFTKARLLAMLPEHMLFTWCGAVITAGQHLLAQFTAHGHWSTQPAHVGFTMWLGAALLSIFSTLNLLLTHRLARVLGADEREALWTLLLMATANAAFYHARHLLPYEVALTAALLALVVGLRAATRARAFACGLLVAAAYGLYNGYWYLVPVVGLVHAFSVRDEAGARRLIAGFATGAGLGLALPIAFGTLVGGRYFWAILTEFSGSVKQGSMAEGWSLPWEYFWHAEGIAGVAIIAAIALALALAWRQGARLERRVQRVLLALLAAYALLVLCSVGLRIFVVYARTVKPFVPLFCLLGGWAVARLLAARPRLAPFVAAAAVAAGAVQFWPHFTRLYPREIEIAVLRNWGNPKHTLTFSGAIYVPLALPVSRPDLVLVNAQLLHPVHHYLGYPAGKTLLRLEHPLTYLAFQYEGHHPRERALLRAHDISIRLIALADPAAVPDDLPEPLRAQPPPAKP